MALLNLDPRQKQGVVAPPQTASTSPDFFGAGAAAGGPFGGGGQSLLLGGGAYPTSPNPKGWWAAQGALSQYHDAAYAGQAEETKNRQTAIDTISKANDAANKPTITQEEIDRQFGRKASAAGQNMLDSMSALREYMGSSGVFGGGSPMGMAGNFNLQYLASLNQSRGDLMSFKATSDALDRQKMFDRSQVLAGAQNSPISMLGIDFENQNTQTLLAKYGMDQQAKAAKNAGQNQLLGAGIGAVGTALGGLL